jgi:hypothetical protein
MSNNITNRRYAIIMPSDPHYWRKYKGMVIGENGNQYKVLVMTRGVAFVSHQNWTYSKAHVMDIDGANYQDHVLRHYRPHVLRHSKGLVMGHYQDHVMAGVVRGHGGPSIFITHQYNFCTKL